MLVTPFPNTTFSQAQKAAEIVEAGTALPQGVENVVGSNYLIRSKALKQERNIQVYLPQSYGNSGKNYPVLYVLDGQRWFLYGVQLLNQLGEYGYTPEFIVVGITNQYPQRFGFFSSDSTNFLHFIERDVISFIDNNFQTSGERMLFGWEYGGGFTVEAMTRAPGLFDAYFAASPFPVAGARIEALDTLLSENSNLNKFLLFATTPNEGTIKEGAAELADLLTMKAPKTLRWTFRKLGHETQKTAGHRTTPYGTLYHGLRNYFYEYPDLEFNSIGDYKKAGGFEYVNEYYQQRAQRYGLPAEISSEGMFFLVKLGLEEDHYLTFEFFMNEFKNMGFLDGVNLGWASRYAEFYLKHDEPAGAIDVYRFLMNKFPEEARPIHGMGKAYLAMGDVDKAGSYYKKAVKLGKANSDWRLSEYEADLVGLTK